MEARKTVLQAAQNHVMVHHCMACDKARLCVASCAASWLVGRTDKETKLATEPVLQVTCSVAKVDAVAMSR